MFDSENLLVKNLLKAFKSHVLKNLHNFGERETF